MKYAIQKYMEDVYIENMVMWTVRAVAVIFCIGVIVAALVIIGTVLGELIWVIIPARK